MQKLWTKHNMTTINQHIYEAALISTAKLTIFTSDQSCNIWQLLHRFYFKILNFPLLKCNHCICHMLIQKQLLYHLVQLWFSTCQMWTYNQHSAVSPRSTTLHAGTEQKRSYHFIAALFLLCFLEKVLIQVA